jgi:hypothetical protein
MLVSCITVAAISSAFVTRPCTNCVFAEQYYYYGGSYVPAGTFGYDFYCLDFGGVCTYYKPNPISQPNTYLPCRSGVHTIIP